MSRWMRSEQFERALKILVKSGADINATDNNGKTPIFHCSNNSMCWLEMLKSGADMNVKDNTGRRPLHEAVLEFSKGTSKDGVLKEQLDTLSLLTMNSDINAVDANGYTALYYAFNPNEFVSKELREDISVKQEIVKLLKDKDTGEELTRKKNQQT